MMPYFTPTDLFRHFCHFIKSIKQEIFNFLLIGLGERSGSVVECLTRDRGAVGSSLTGVTALWSLSKIHLYRKIVDWT